MKIRARRSTATRLCCCGRRPFGDMDGSRPGTWPAAQSTCWRWLLNASISRSRSSTSTTSNAFDADTRTGIRRRHRLEAPGVQRTGATARCPLHPRRPRWPPSSPAGPADRSALNFTKLLAQRSTNLRRAIHNLNLVAGALGGVDTQLASLVDSSNTNFQAIASQDQALEQGSRCYRRRCGRPARRWARCSGSAAISGPALTNPKPFAKNLGPALTAVGTLAKTTTPAIEKQLEPFASNPAIHKLVQTLAPAAASLAKAAPALSSSFAVLNTLVNTLAYQQKGAAPGYLYWAGWLAHNLDSLTSLQDADGSMLQGQFIASRPRPRNYSS